MDDRTNLMSPRPLNAGSTLARYTIREVIGISGTGITYKAYDRELDLEVTLGEYLPSARVLRNAHNHLQPISTAHEQQYTHGLANYIQVASTLKQFSHSNIANVRNVFEQNNTAYTVMDSEYGVSLDSIINQCGTLEQSHQIRIFFPVFDGLQKFHELGLIHSGIKPTNIRIRENGTPVLLDFGNAQLTSHQSPTQSTALVNQSYMPLEQFSDSYGEQGPWSDIYSLAAIMHQGVTGTKPDEALVRSDYMLRAQPDSVHELPTSAYPNYEQAFLRAVHAGLTLQPQIRPQSLNHWQLLFEGNFEAYLSQSAAMLSESAASRGVSRQNSSTSNSHLTYVSAETSDSNTEHSKLRPPFTAKSNSAENVSINELDTALGASAAGEADEQFRNAVDFSLPAEKKKISWKLLIAGCATAVCIALVTALLFF